ncbi:hypothetical protein PHLCEN_2v11949 [Hermanssonia centrifuga]|uniref:RING-type E3 ubiquitin transferase n=1 Tax=Hermanssonia centrifuga TaxID=98765 RepID=A0A2R6NID0_9APHY|nr:hypothetical protein PHLCEN_2v11949 [Hermanssonia centrifuga]
MPLNDLIRQRVQPLTAAFTSNRIFLYAVFSTVATLTTVANACRNYSNFYAVMVYLSKSGRSLLVLANFGFLSALFSGRVVQRIFFGPLQPREIERLYDQTWMFVTESLLAFTIFRDDFDIPFVIMFGFLLFIKCFHWLMADRMESMDQVPYPGPPLLFHVRINSLFLILWLVDFVMLAMAIDSTLTNGVGGMVLFANEYAILMASALNSMARYTLSNLDMRRARTRGGANAPAWENKSMYIFYIELVTDFLKLATYLTFFTIVLTFYGLPLNMIRDVWLTARSFTSRLRALVRYHNATRDMDRRYPNATEEELTAMSDRTCIICREEMIAVLNNQTPPAEGAAPPPPNNNQEGPNVTPKKLPCGHIFHFQCLRSWLERQQSCPTCRRTVLETDQPSRNVGQAGPRGARPAAPQPGAAPQQPQAGQQAANGPLVLGWLARFMGIAAQPPLVPGQFPNAPFPQFVPGGPQQIPANAGWPAPGQQLPPGYAYPFQYQMQPPVQLQPPPIYRGFYGPGGVWQPWGMDAQALAQGQQAPANQPQPQTHQQPQPVTSPSSQAAAPGLSADQSQAPTRIPPVDSPQAEPSNFPTPSDADSAPATDRPSTPREAAALAALRRHNSSQTSVTTDTQQPASVVPSNDGAVTDITNAPSTSPPSEMPLEASASAFTAASASGSASTPATIPENRVEIPSLIPLYDLGSYAQSVRIVPQYAQPSHFLRQQGGRMQNPLQPGAPGPSQGYRASHTPAPNRTPAEEHRHRPGPARGPLAQLPPTLTDEQLARLDHLTRDAIDERLRVLEGLSGVVYRCIEELTRIRSVLPPRYQTITTPNDPATPNEGSSANTSNSSSSTSVTPQPVNGHSGSPDPGKATPLATNPTPEESNVSSGPSEPTPSSSSQARPAEAESSQPSQTTRQRFFVSPSESGTLDSID